MSLHCPTGSRAEFPPPAPPPKPERGAPWAPPDTTRDRCLGCGRLAWQHAAVLDPIARTT